MPTVEQLRRILNRNRAWSLYALADLDEPLFSDCYWRVVEDESLALVYTGITIRPVFTLTSGPEVTRRLLAELPFDSGYLNLRDEERTAADGVFEFTGTPYKAHRMLLREFHACADRSGIVRLTAAHASEVRRLYDMDPSAGIAFGEFMLNDGYFRGIRAGGELVAVAGTHVVSRKEGVAGVGNIFTHPDYRGRGLAQRTTSAVTAALVRAGIQTIGLNVYYENLPAIAAYRKLGFDSALTYWEGPARKRAV